MSTHSEFLCADRLTIIQGDWEPWFSEVAWAQKLPYLADSSLSVYITYSAATGLAVDWVLGKIWCKTIVLVASAIPLVNKLNLATSLDLSFDTLLGL